MHIPDGFLSPPVWATLDAIAVPSVALMARRAKQQIGESNIPLLGVMGAFVFAAQMINFPVGLGTSAHLVGGALLAIVLGPAAASIVMTSILAIQALVFQDGGTVVLGANVMNMAVVGVLAGWIPYRILSARTRTLSMFVAGFASVIVSATLALAELLASGVRMPAAGFWASVAVFVINAVIEGVITAAAVQAIERLHPQWVRRPAGIRSPVFVSVAALALLLAGVGVLIASQAPDGIEQIGKQTGLTAFTKSFTSPLAGYQMHGVDALWLRRVLGGLAGVVIVYLMVLVVGCVVARRQTDRLHAGTALQPSVDR